MNRMLFPIFLLIMSIPVCAQEENIPPKEDSLYVHNLAEVVVKGYEQGRKLLEVPSAINYIGKSQLDRFSNTGILPAFNSTPGVRMEERSPGSYRVNVRGSSLRSPFGVRNVKIYWDGIPFTDPGGNTYLNQLSFYNFHTIEIIKGPASSLYGSGTGGAILINSQPAIWNAGTDIHYVRGSFNMNSINAQIRLGNDVRENTFNYTHQSGDGYRNHTNMRRSIATWQTLIRAGSKQKISASVLYSDLYYQTPGALNATEYNKDPKAARPAAGIFPGAEKAKAAIYQKNFLTGITNEYLFSNQFQNTSVLYGAFSIIKNPTFRNYEKRVEPHFGGRTVFKWDRSMRRMSLQVRFGGEAQSGYFHTKTFKNKNGNPDTLLTDDEINNWIYSVFAQAELRLPNDWNVMAGVSVNKSSISITRLSVPGAVPKQRTYSNEWAPRVAISKKIIPGMLVYASVSRGFSPPTVQEVLPSTSVISTGLEAEQGVSYEAGFKSSWLKNRLYVEVNAFSFQLRNTIVQRRDSSGGDYFINAGSTRQRGIESQVSYQFVQHPDYLLSHVRIWLSHSWNKFNYNDFKQVSNNYSGRQLPGVATHTIASGLDIMTKPGLYANVTYFYSDPIALNDANTAYASSYHLLGGRIGLKNKMIRKLTFNLFVGADNLFDARYSLGNDINAAGGRFYNAAAGINYYAGISLGVPGKK